MQPLQDSPCTILRCPELWFSDNTIVIEAGNMQFQVHTDVLTRQSEVFRDLLSLPQPADSETIDGSPLVRIEGTTAENMRLFLACLHDCTEYDRLPLVSKFVLTCFKGTDPQCATTQRWRRCCGCLTSTRRRNFTDTFSPISLRCSRRRSTNTNMQKRRLGGEAHSSTTHY